MNFVTMNYVTPAAYFTRCVIFDRNRRGYPPICIHVEVAHAHVDVG